VEPCVQNKHEKQALKGRNEPGEFYFAPSGLDQMDMIDYDEGLHPSLFLDAHSGLAKF